MKVLLVHQNFPGQFRHVAPALVKRGHEVAVITDATNTGDFPFLVARYGHSAPDKAKIAEAGGSLVSHHAQMVARGVAAARVAAKLRTERGFVPDLIFAHPGWGETLFLKEVWPEARMLLYAEFYYASRGQDSDFDPEFQSYSLTRALRTVAMRTHIAQAMTEADAALAPTAWQASTFPPCFRDRIDVIHDGIDTAALHPDAAAKITLPGVDTLRHGDEVLTFVVRNIEPYRGAHIFFRALPEVLKARPEARVVIVGGDDVSYGARPPNGTWKQRLLDELGDRLDLGRVHFTGRLPYGDLCRLLQVSRVHAYLTYPFVLSWSLMEAMSLGCAILASRTAPVQEVIEDGVNGRLIDFFDVKAWSDGLTEALANPEALRPLRAAARRTIEARYDLKLCLPRILDLAERTAQA
jgi:glycosyltransferase involved in cell wall biosynthesis